MRIFFSFYLTLLNDLSHRLTAFDVAKPEFRNAFASKNNFTRPASMVSVRSIQRRASSASLSSVKTYSSTSPHPFSSARGTALRREAMSRMCRLRDAAVVGKLCKGFEDISGSLQKFSRDVEQRSCSPEDDDCSTIGCSNDNESSSRSGDIASIKASLYDASRASTEIFSVFRKILNDACDELRQCQAAYDSADALGEQIEDVLRERDIASFPCVPDAGLRRPSLSSLGASSLSSATTTLVGSSVSSPVSPSSSPKKGDEEFGALMSVTEAHEWRVHEMNSSIAARQRDSAWPSWFNSILQRKANAEETNMSHLVKLVEFEKMGLVTRTVDDKCGADGHSPISRGSKKGGLLKMGTRCRKDSKSRQAKARAAVEALETWADLADDKSFLELMGEKESDFVDADPFRCEDSSPQKSRLDEVKSREGNRRLDSEVKTRSSASRMPVSPLSVKKRVKTKLFSFDLLDGARKELAGLDAQLSGVCEHNYYVLFLSVNVMHSRMKFLPSFEMRLCRPKVMRIVFYRYVFRALRINFVCMES